MTKEIMKGTTNAEMSTVFSFTRPKLVETGKLCTGNISTSLLCLWVFKSFAANTWLLSLVLFICIFRKHPGFVIK